MIFHDLAEANNRLAVCKVEYDIFPNMTRQHQIAAHGDFLDFALKDRIY